MNRFYFIFSLPFYNALFTRLILLEFFWLFFDNTLFVTQAFAADLKIYEGKCYSQNCHNQQNESG